MKITFVSLFLVSCALVTIDAQARDTRHKFDVAPVLEKYADRLEGVAFYFGNTAPKATRTMGEFQSNKKTNAFNKSDQKACEWALLSALLSFKQRALNEGGNAVVAMWSNYKKNRFESDTQFECGAGGLMAGVTIKGTVALIE